MTFGFLPEPVTTLENVFTLEKGSCKVFNVQTLSSVQHYFYRESYSNEITDPLVAKESVRNHLIRSVSRHLVSDAPIGLFLSGGIDSSILTILAQEFKPDDLHTLSLVFEDQEFSEQVYQDIIIKKTGARHQSFLVTKNDFEDSFDDILLAMDQPSTDGINSYFICKYARKAGLKAVLSGLGADELLGGYPSFKRTGPSTRGLKIFRVVLGLTAFSPKDNYRKLSFLQRHDPVGEYLFYRGYDAPSETARLLGTTIADVNDTLGP